MSWATRYVGRSDLHCWGLVCEVYRERLGVELPIYGEVDAKALQAVAEAVATGRIHTELWKQIAPFPGAERECDVVVMRGWLPCADGQTRRGVVHTGVVSRIGHVMHTDMQYQIVEVPLSHVTVRRRLVGCYRYAALG